jgi:hypothetical protein
MPLGELDRWLRGRADRQPATTNLSMLDSYVTAIVTGPVSFDPREWIYPLLAIDADAFNHSGTPEFGAISARAATAEGGLQGALLTNKDDTWAKSLGAPLTGATQGRVLEQRRCRGFECSASWHGKNLWPKDRGSIRNGIGSSAQEQDSKRAQRDKVGAPQVCTPLDSAFCHRAFRIQYLLV